MSVWDLTKEEVPEHLLPLKEIIHKANCFDVRDEEYAAIGYKLILVCDGDKKALKEVADFIQKQQSSLKNMERNFNEFIRQVISWMYWAKYWVVRSPTQVKFTEKT